MKKSINIFIFICIFLFLVTYFKPGLILNDNVIAGGDTPSHYGLAHYVTETNEISSWMPGNFAGFPALQFYSPIPFYLIALLDRIFPFPVAFKLIVILGTFLIPIASFYCLHKLRFTFPTPILGAILSLVFLYNEGNSMWGGNILSTLAGEFSYSLGFALAIACLGILYDSISSGKGIKYPAILLALVGLIHGYPFVFLIMAGSFFFLIIRNGLNIILHLIKLYTLAFILMGFWIIPALIYYSYTTPFNFVWRFNNIQELFPVLYYPIIALMIITHSYLLLSKRMEVRTIYLWYTIIMSIIGYLSAVHLGLVDIRFIPFIQIAIVLLAAIGLGDVMKEYKAVTLLPVAVILLTFTGISITTRSVAGWINYNFSGFENKILWNEFNEVNKYLRGSIADPRVVYEHSPRHEGAGTVRAFELLPLFSGRSTLEGLYMQSSLSSPYVYYIQSEVSQQGSHPLINYNYPGFDLKRAVRHLVLFNVSQFITITEETQTAATVEPAFILEKEINPYKIFRLTDNTGKYVVPLRYKPIFVDIHDRKRLFFNWFRLSGNNDVFLISGNNTNIPGGYRAVLSTSLDLRELPATPLDEDVRVEEDVRSHEIIIKTTRLNHPLLIKCSYHPNWHVDGAETIYLASPGFMIIFPSSYRVRLYYGPGIFTYIGWAASFFGLLLVLLPLKYTRFRPDLTSVLKLRWLIFIGLTTGIIGWGFYYHYDPHILYQNGMKYFQREDYEKAQRIFSKGIREFPYSPAIDVSYLYYGLCSYKQEQWEKAIDIWSDFIEEYPDGRTADEILYHMVLTYQFLGQENKSETMLTRLKTQFPRSRFTELLVK